MSLWRDHGTKLLGYGLTAMGTVVAAVTAVDPALVTAVAGPKYGAWYAVGAAVIGAAVARRGHTNSNPPQ